MPTPYLLKLNEETGIPLPKLEIFWKKATEIAKERPNFNYGSVVTIFKNMFSLSYSNVSESKDCSNVDVSKISWFTKKSPSGQKIYLQRHPNSCLVESIKKKKTTEKNSKKKRVSQLEDTDTVEQINYLPTAQPMEEPTKRNNSLKNMFTVGSKAINSVVKSIGKPLETINDSMEEYINTGHISPSTRKLMGSIVKSIILVGVAAGVFYLTPTAAPVLLEKFLEFRSSSSGKVKNVLEEDNLTKFINEFNDWLTNQDLDKISKES